LTTTRGKNLGIEKARREQRAYPPPTESGILALSVPSFSFATEIAEPFDALKGWAQFSVSFFLPVRFVPLAIVCPALLPSYSRIVHSTACSVLCHNRHSLPVSSSCNSPFVVVSFFLSLVINQQSFQCFYGASIVNRGAEFSIARHMVPVGTARVPFSLCAFFFFG
jgi:hypothetical protein